MVRRGGVKNLKVFGSNQGKSCSCIYKKRVEFETACAGAEKLLKMNQKKVKSVTMNVRMRQSKIK